MIKFWMCYNRDRGKPTTEHLTLDEAKIEAERLCRKEGKRIAVLECIGYVKEREVPIDFVEATETFGEVGNEISEE